MLLGRRLHALDHKSIRPRPGHGALDLFHLNVRLAGLFGVEIREGAVRQIGFAKDPRDVELVAGVSD